MQLVRVRERIGAAVTGVCARSGGSTRELGSHRCSDRRRRERAVLQEELPSKEEQHQESGENLVAGQEEMRQTVHGPSMVLAQQMVHGSAGKWGARWTEVEILARAMERESPEARSAP